MWGKRTRTNENNSSITIYVCIHFRIRKCEENVQEQTRTVHQHEGQSEDSYWVTVWWNCEWGKTLKIFFSIR